MTRLTSLLELSLAFKQRPCKEFGAGSIGLSVLRERTVRSTDDDRSRRHRRAPRNWRASQAGPRPAAKRAKRRRGIHADGVTSETGAKHENAVHPVPPLFSGHVRDSRRGRHHPAPVQPPAQGRTTLEPIIPRFRAYLKSPGAEFASRSASARCARAYHRTSISGHCDRPHLIDYCRGVVAHEGTYESVCGPPKWKLENDAQTPAPETRPSTTETPKIACPS
jgi:hypothetical protein